MAIKLKKIGKGEEKKIEITMDNSHIECLENIVHKYNSIKNEGHALDFIIKSVGDNRDNSHDIVIDGVSYSPADYDE